MDFNKEFAAWILLGPNFLALILGVVRGQACLLWWFSPNDFRSRSTFFFSRRGYEKEGLATGWSFQFGATTKLHDRISIPCWLCSIQGVGLQGSLASTAPTLQHVWAAQRVCKLQMCSTEGCSTEGWWQLGRMVRPWGSKWWEVLQQKPLLVSQLLSYLVI